MARTGADLLKRECRTIGRLRRLFRVERAGGFARWPAETIEAVLRRREQVIQEFLRLEGERRARILPLVPELHRAVTDLTQEIEESQRSAETRLVRLRSEIRIARGEGMPSGIRGGAGGRRIGQG